jgi:hypothetical protein
MLKNLLDNSVMILKLDPLNHRLCSPFKFLNLWADHEDFLPAVNSVWHTLIQGNLMYQLTSKLWLLKNHLKTFHKHHSSHISSRVAKAKEEWDTAQLQLDQNPAGNELRINERRLARKYKQLCDDEKAYFKQKSRVQWLHLRDKNTSFFQKSLIYWQSRNKIHSLKDASGNLINDQ